MRLPPEIDPLRFDEGYRLDHAAWRAAVAEVCVAHGLPCEIVSPFPDGSNLVAAVDGRFVVKIFPPFHEHQWESERRVLAHLRGATLPLRVPELVAQGRRAEGWPYVVLERLPGLPMESCWPDLALTDRARLLEQIGGTIAAVHGLPLGDLANLPPEWSSFLQEQKSRCRARHARLALPPWMVNSVDEFVCVWAGEEGRQENQQDRVLLTGEYTPFNLLVQRDASGWQLTGMLDFGDAMIGPRDYDLLGPALFSAGGDPQLIAALFRGYHAEERPLSRPRRMRFMALAALHRYAHFDVQIRIPEWRERARSIEELAELIWPQG